MAARSERGHQASARAVEIARRLGDPAALTLALNGRDIQSFRHDGLEERLRLGAELLALPGKPVTAEALAHLMLMRANSGAADFRAADQHADEAARIAGRYDLPMIATRVSFYRAQRTALDGDLPAAGQLYQQAAAEMGRLGMWQHGAAVGVMGTFCLRVIEDRSAEIAQDLEPFYNYPPWSAMISEMYALTLAAAGRISEGRAVAAKTRPIRRDLFWLFMTGVRGLLAVAIDDHDRAESSYQALLPYAARPAGADSALLTLWPAAQILGDLARYLCIPGAEAHYRHALAIAGQARVEPWRQAAMRQLD